MKYLVNLAPRRHSAVPPDGERRGIRQISGWSDAVLRFIANDARGLAGQVAQIRKIEV